MADQPTYYTSDSSSLVQRNVPAARHSQSRTNHGYPNLPPGDESAGFGIPDHGEASTPTPEHYGLHRNPTIPPLEFVYHSNPSHFTQQPPPYSVTMTGRVELCQRFEDVFAVEINQRERRRSSDVLIGVCSQVVLFVCLLSAKGEPTPAMREMIMREVIQQAGRFNVTVTGKDIAKYIRFASCVLINLYD